MSHPKKGDKVTFKIEGRTYDGRYGDSLLEQLRKHGYEVPSLCYHEAVSPYGSCRLCLVEVKKGKKQKVTTSCNYPVQEGIEVFVNTEKVRRYRKVVLQLHLSKTPKSKAVRDLAAEYGVMETPYEVQEQDKDNDCVLCGLCSRVCDEIVHVSAISFTGRGQNKRMQSPYDETAEACIGCGACVYVCPTDCIGLQESDGIRHIEKWHRDLPLQTCEKCGKQFFPTFMLMEFSKRTGISKDQLNICPACRNSVV